jgi:hypothetical protein
MAGCIDCHDSASIADVAAAVKPLGVETAFREAHAVSFADYRGEIANDDRNIVSRAPLAEETDDAFLPVGAVDPLKGFFALRESALVCSSSSH